MISKSMRSIILVLLIFLFGCSCSQNRSESKIRRVIERDLPALASCSAVISQVLTVYEDNWIASDDIYIIEGIAEVYYGYDLDKIKIDIVREGGKKILKVTLPELKEISRNWKVNKVHTTHKNYIPRDEQGNFLDVNQRLNIQLDEKSKRYRERAKQIALASMKHYFSMIADSFGFDLEIRTIEDLLPVYQPPKEK